MIYLSKQIKNWGQYGNLYVDLTNAFFARKIGYRLLADTCDVWLRDFMPIRTKSGRWISFRYDPSYLKGYDDLRTDYISKISPQLDLPIIPSKINLDGGNVVFSPSRRRAIISDRVFDENKDMDRSSLTAELKQLLEAEIIFIPSLEPDEDMTGHADGMVRFLDENTVLGNEPIDGGELESEIKQRLIDYGIDVIDFPYYETGKVKNGIVSAAGSYLNYLETERCIFLPQFGGKRNRDAEAVAKAEELFQKEIVPIPCAELAARGGVLNCISWEM